MTHDTTAPAPETPPPVDGRRLHPAAWAMIAAVALVALVAATFGAVRYGLVTSPGRLFIEARLEGLKVGRMGRLHVAGIEGDIFDDFTVKTLTITDEEGVWLEAHDVRVDWNYAALIGRRFEADEISARIVRLLRRPTLTPKTADQGMPISFRIKALRARIETLPAFSYRRGLFDLTGALDVQRDGPNAGEVHARSRLRQGDRLDAEFVIGDQRLHVDAEAVEAAGGALAGSLGLPADRPFALSAQARGSMAAGRLTMTVRSGARVPARALGEWGAAGGQVAARLDLAASRLTEDLARRFGPSVSIAVGGRQVDGALYALDGRAASGNLTVAFKGQANLAERETGPEGLGIAAAVASLDRLGAGPLDGRAGFKGVLKGGLSDFALKGELSGSGLTSGAYRLAGLGGPAALSRDGGEWTLTADLDGTGGGGEGYLAAVLGTRPSLQLAAARLADGRLLLREVEASGAGLAVQARGQRGLFGGLSFEGDARVSNLAAVRPGAGGVLNAKWSARRPSGEGRPWAFTLDASGQAFSSGLDELDRLLGRAPRLQVRADYGDGAVRVAQAHLDAEAADVRAAGTMARGGALNFNVNWVAEGPFGIGPVEVSGDASGQGTITGAADAPRAELTAAFAAIDAPRLPLTDAQVTLVFEGGEQDRNGRFALEAASPYGPAAIRTDFSFIPGGVRLSGLDADAGGIDLAGSVALQRGRPSTADLEVAVGPGALLTHGRVAGSLDIVDSAAGARADLKLTATNAAVRGASQVEIASAVITANGPLARLPLAFTANGAAGPGPWRIEAEGMLASADTGYTLSLGSQGRVGRARFQTVEDAVLRFGGETRSARLRLRVGRGAADLDASLTDAGAEVRAVLDDVALGAFNEDMAGRMDATLTLQGQGERLTGALDATLENARAAGMRGGAALDGTITARLSGQALSLQAAATNADGLRANAAANLPVEASASPFRLAIANRRPMSGRFFADGDIGPLWDLFVGGERRLSGRVVAEGTLDGTLADPTMNGQVDMTGGAFEDYATGLRLDGLSLAAALRGEAIDVSRVAATDGAGGRVGGQGRISLERDGVSSFRMTLNGFQVIDNDLARAAASGEATLNRDASGRIKLTGALSIDRAEIAAEPPTPSGVVVLPVTEINKPPGVAGGLRAEASRGVAVALDVSLDAPRRVFVRGRGLDVEMSLDAHVGGTTRDPALTGEARVVRGTYEFAGKRFEFEERGVIHLSTRPENIRLDLRAVREDPALTAIINVSGTAARPRIALTSNPALPSDEVLSRVLFGASASQLSTLEAAQLAAGLAALAGGGGFDIVGGLRGLTGLDRLTFGGGESGLTVAGGKYLTDDVYLEIIGGGREGPVVQVEWRVRRNLAVVSRVAAENDARLSVRWRRDY